MKSGILPVAALLVGGAAVLTGCVNLPDAVRDQLDCAAPDNFGNESCAHARWQGLPIAAGQIIVNEKFSSTSLALALLVERYEPYTHAGLVVFDDGSPYVYEAWAIYKPRLSGRPTRNAGGGIRRVSLASFLRRGGTIAIHEPPAGVDRDAVVAYARARRAERTGFDEFFDARDPGKMYCTEFVARALEAGGAPPFDGIAVNANPSVRVMLDWFEVRAPRLLMVGELLRDTRRIVLLDRRRGLAQIDIEFARRRELHRRFTSDQKLGNVFRWTGFGLAFRPSVAAYVAGRRPLDDQRIQVGVPSSD
jgi:hypothetical protein